MCDFFLQSFEYNFNRVGSLNKYQFIGVTFRQTAFDYLFLRMFEMLTIYKTSGIKNCLVIDYLLKNSY